MCSLSQSLNGDEPRVVPGGRGGDENSRRDPEKHTARLRAVSEKINNLAAALPKPIKDRVPLRRAGFDQLPQYRAYAPGSTTAVTDSVLLVYRDLR